MSEPCIVFACIALVELFIIAEMIAGARSRESEYSNRELRAAVKIAQLRQELSSKPLWTTTYYPPQEKGK